MLNIQYATAAPSSQNIVETMVNVSTRNAIRTCPKFAQLAQQRGLFQASSVGLSGYRGNLRGHEFSMSQLSGR